MKTGVCGVAVLAVCFFFSGILAHGEDSYSPDAGRAYPVNVYWGDTHVHTSFSTGDANLAGKNYLPRTLAFRFARGEGVEAPNGMLAQLRRPLDFLVIADHAENLGVAFSLQSKNPALLETEAGRALYEKYQATVSNPGSAEARSAFGAALYGAPRQLGASHAQSVWDTIAADADAYNEPGVFTAFAGYEWSSPGPVAGTFGNLHRVVIFRDGAEMVTKVRPFSAYDSLNPEDLWAFLAGYQEKTGGDVMAIPHNANMSYGEMFKGRTSDGSALTAGWARMRSRWEPLYEVTQFKGDSETHPILSPTDEFADFETWNNWAGETLNPGEIRCCPDWDPSEQPERKKAEYARSALKQGLDQQVKLGVNPFKFGLIGSTDSHTSLATADNDNFWGKFTTSAPSRTRMGKPFHTSAAWNLPLQWETGAAGYAGVWAVANTREALFAAMKRKEVYATTGPRMTVRFFGGWAFSSEDALRPDFARAGYGKGVPMGGDLVNGPAGQAPSFLIRAVKDPDGANLDRVQVIKGWRDTKGALHEEVYDVALSDGRKAGRGGKVKGVGNTVDVKDASYANSIGAAELAVVWQDPDFDGEEPAFYYVRVLEIPTPRWTAYDAKFYGLTDLPEGVRMVSQERAYTSPIWYTP